MPTDVSSRRGARPIAVKPPHHLKNATLSGSSDAMNMAWTVIFTLTMFRLLDFKPTHQLVER
jgi:hypothetical protein